ncbi:aminoglycoside phosphotransferase family protein [Streptomyces uncialis]|uniref:aminoglycoside phosphotransferase family protein n=1 Tax=Streptomyces uncialis TaxID=1048205 RepID=UPI0033C84559
MVLEAPERLVRALAEARALTHGGSPPADGSADDSADGKWLDALPGLFADAVERAGLSVERVRVPGGRSSLVALVRTADGTPAALKLAPPGARPERERAALEHWAGVGAVRTLAGPVPPGALLLERLSPDVPVRSLPEAKSMLEAVGVLRRLWVAPPVGHGFETVTGLTGRQATEMRAGADAQSADLVDAALAAREELLADPPGDEVLLHGTFRQSKVLAGERTPWLAVGPDPLVGEGAFDLARLVRDRVEDLVAAPSGAGVARRRMRRLAEALELDAERVRGWALFRAVESGVRAYRAGRTADAELTLEFATWL